MAFHTKRGRVITYHCLRCGHTWAPRVLEWPRLCPRCKSKHWDTARVTRQGLRKSTHRRPR